MFASVGKASRSGGWPTPWAWLLMLGGLMGCAPALYAQGRPGWVQSSSEAVSSRQSRMVARLVSDNTEPVGLVGGQVRATLVAYRLTPGTGNRVQGHLEFSIPVLVNAFSRKVCHNTSCAMEVRFDNQPGEKFGLFEAGPDVYMKRVLVLDSAFFKKAFKSRTMAIKLKFADAVEGVFHFRNPSGFDWSD